MEFPVLTRATLVPVDPAMSLPGALVAHGGQVVYRPSRAISQDFIDQIRLMPAAGEPDQWVQLSGNAAADGTLVVTFHNPTHENAMGRVVAWGGEEGPANTCQGVAECKVIVGVELDGPEITVLPQG
jgi:hypothetical protein